jgi:methionine aminopeptidase
LAKGDSNAWLYEKMLKKRLAKLEEIKQQIDAFKRYLYAVEIPEDNGSNYLHWDKPVDTKIVERVANGLQNVGFELDAIAHNVLDNSIEGFTFSHGLGHGIGINVHEAPPANNQTEIAKQEFKDNMCYTIEPGLYNPEYFGVRLENSCYRKNGENVSFVKMGFEGKLINLDMLSAQEQEWLKEFVIL